LPITAWTVARQEFANSSHQLTACEFMAQDAEPDAVAAAAEAAAAFSHATNGTSYISCRRWTRATHCVHRAPYIGGRSVWKTELYTILTTVYFCGWLGSRVVSVLDSGAEGPRFKSQPRRCRVTALGKLFTPLCLCSPSSKIGSSPLKGCGGNCRPGRKYWQPTAGFMTHVTCRLTAENRATLGNRVWATFTFTSVAKFFSVRGWGKILKAKVERQM